MHGWCAVLGFVDGPGIAAFVLSLQIRYLWLVCGGGFGFALSPLLFF